MTPNLAPYPIWRKGDQPSVAALVCTSRELLPEMHKAMSRADMVGRIVELMGRSPSSNSRRLG